MPRNEFFNEMTEGSEVKTEIVRKYFWAWAKVIAKQIKKRGKGRMAYIDLFAGRGRYHDGTPSTPILILKGAIRDADIAPLIETYFNDADLDNAKALGAEINNLAGIETLKHRPVIRAHEVGDALAQKFEHWHVPTLFFLDPWGYKGLSLNLIKAALAPWGCDCIFFFNYNRINAALPNPVFTENMNHFFGAERANRLRQSLTGRDPQSRQDIIIDALKELLNELGGKFTLTYCFKDDSGQKTSHFLIFASKNVLGYNIMKSIMGAESSSADHGVPSFGFNPLDKERASERDKSPTLFDLTDPIEDLANTLACDFSGRTLSVEAIYREHHVGKRYVLKNYQDALRKLEEQARIVADPPRGNRVRAGRVTFGTSVMVTFLPKRAD